MSTKKTEYAMFSFRKDCAITRKTERFEPTASGKGWKSKPSETETDSIDEAIKEIKRIAREDGVEDDFDFS